MSLEVALSRMAQLQSMFAAPAALTQTPAPTTTLRERLELRVEAAVRERGVPDARRPRRAPPARRS